jgi:iron only hydrogenase large subunit-like protein
VERPSPIYTEKSRCQDCYKCVRNCPVKAITIENGSARVEKELCMYCGTCVLVCPQGAKTVRNDLPAVRQLLQDKKRVYAAVAPSYVSEFPDIGPENLITVLLRLGFAGVSETALGAQEVSAEIARRLAEQQDNILISSACPVIVEYVKKYFPDYGSSVADMLSPLLAQCRLLRREYGDDIGIVFIGPCIAKKREADFFPDLLDASLTFHEFRFWLESEGLSLREPPAAAENLSFVPEKAREGVLYPVDGGMTAGIKANCSVSDLSCMVFSGITNIPNVLSGLLSARFASTLFLELLACSGGCINGPGGRSRGETVRKRITVLSRADLSAGEDTAAKLRPPAVDITASRGHPAVEQEEFSPAEIREALESVGKYSPADELDCSGCGYASCRDFAAALVSGKAERTMCVSYTRRIAQKESNKLLAAMPSAAVILDANLKILDCNRRFAAFLGDEIEHIFNEGISLEGVKIEKYLPFADLFKQVLKTNEEISNYDVKLKHYVLSCTIFPVETHAVVGAILQDVTEPVVRKEQVIGRARQVIRKNLATAQQIASLLGENAADSEAILDSIIKTFTTPHDKTK